MHGTNQKRLLIRLWGGVAIWRPDGSPVPLPSRRARALVAILALAGGEPVPRDRLAGLLWDGPESRGRANLRQLLYELKALTGPNDALIGADPGQLWLNLSRSEVDALRLESLDAGELAESVPARDACLAPDLDGVTEALDEWLDEQRRLAEAALARSIARVGQEALSTRRYSEARALADAATARDPLDEASAQIGLKADAALGDHASLTRRYRRLKASLAEDLGVPPSPATRAFADAWRESAADAAPPEFTGPAPPTPDVVHQPATVSPKRGRRRLAFAGAGLAAALAAGGAVLLPAKAPLAQRGELVFDLETAAKLTREARALNRVGTPDAYAQADGLLREAIARNAGDPRAWAELAVATRLPVMWNEQRPPEALIEPSPDAVRDVDEALRLDPRNARALAIKGVLVGEETGSRLLDAALRIDRNDPDIWYWAGNDRWGFARFQEAIEAYRHATALDPAWDKPAEALVLALEEWGDPRGADAALARFAGAARDRAKVEFVSGVLASARGRLGAAAGHFRNAIRLDPRNSAASAGALAELARAVGDQRAMKTLLEVNPELSRLYAPFLEPEGAIQRAQANPRRWWRSYFAPEEERLLLKAHREDLLVSLLRRQTRPTPLAYRSAQPFPDGVGAPLYLALRNAGLKAEAAWLLQAIAGDVHGTAALGYHPWSFQVAEAMCAANQGHDAEAVGWLESAVDGGWRGQLTWASADPADDPVFAPLKARADFQRMRARLLDLVARERPAVEAALRAAGSPFRQSVAAQGDLRAREHG